MPPTAWPAGLSLFRKGKRIVFGIDTYFTATGWLVLAPSLGDVGTPAFACVLQLTILLARPGSCQRCWGPSACDGY